MAGNVFGYDIYMISEEGFCNVVENGKVIGFQLLMRLANYRGYILSQIEDIKINVDGLQIAREDISLRLGDRSYTLDEMADVVDERWEISQTAIVTCLLDDGLKPGVHEIKAEQHIRASYIPITAVSSVSKQLTLTA